MEYLTVTSSGRNQFIDITGEVRNVILKKGVKNGICFLFVPHTTAAVTINEGADPDVARDILAYMEKLVPQRNGFKHAEGNSDAHIKASMFGASEIVHVVDGKLALGTWQAIYFCEFDGPRTRRLGVRVLPV
ncbi:MAG: YjbQ family protein [Nitrospirae bacterium]|nr:YjbQ family protein [Nitrospirota bacterium]